MVVSGVIVETVAGRAAAVASRLVQVAGIEVNGTDGVQRLSTIWKARSGDAMEKLAETLLKADQEILGIYPAFVGKE
jgi:hypothetical protein